MKNLFFSVLLLSSFFGYGQYTLIPDKGFELALIRRGFDSFPIDGRVLTDNINRITTLELTRKGMFDFTDIKDLTGIEGFVSLITLDCKGSKLSTLNLTKNIKLTTLICDDNKLKTIDLTKNVNLEILSCNANLLTSIDISQLVNLKQFSIVNNKLKSIDLSKNTELLSFNCIDNQLTTIDFSNNTKLLTVYCQSNSITDLDFSNNKFLGSLYCSSNLLINLNVKNGNNLKLTDVFFSQNPNLRCIQVDNKSYSDTNWSIVKDATASFSEFCVKATAPIIPPVITAAGNKTYCPGTSLKIVETISITNGPAEPETDAIYIQISSGYILGQDDLKLANPINHPKIVADWDAPTGKLKLSNPTGAKIPYTDFEAAIRDVEFRNSSPSPSGIRNFSITIGQANYLPSTGHYYQYIPNLGITWTAAKIAADTSNYYGLKGYLATILTAEEAQLSGKQAEGAGWIGGSDSQTEGVWKWVTGPEGLANDGTGITFWNGLANGTTPNFAYWNTNEPNQFNGANEDYAHITAPGVGITGSWNDLTISGEPTGNYQPKGYIVEYGGMSDDPVLKISASTTVTMAQLTVIAPNPICASQTIMLQASSTNSTINWFDKATGGNLLQTGNSFTTPQLYTNTTYYIDNGCTTRTPIAVTVEFLPIANPVTITRQCDDNQDGIFTFNTSALETTLLNGQTNVIVTYFDQANAPLKDVNGTLISSPFPASFSTKSQTIQAVLTNNSTLKCSNKTNIDFIVDDLPETFLVPITLTTSCDDEPIPANQDGKFPFNTSNIESTILNGQTGMKVSYFDKNGNPLSSPLPNPFLTDTQNVNAKVENVLNPNCFTTTTLNFVVNPLPIVNNVTITQCDSDLIADGKTLFNLTVNNNVISANYNNETFTYYTSSNGANNDVAADLIPNELAFENTTPTLMDIWSRITNKITGCSSVAKITLKVPATNISPNYKIPFLPVCDDFLDVNGNNTADNNNRDGITAFDFSATKANVKAQLPTSQAYNINYYRNESDALAETNVITNISNYRNIGYPNSQDIWIRIDSDLDNACYGLGPYLTLNVEALPNIDLNLDGDDDNLVCQNNPTFYKQLNAGIQDGTLTSNYTYVWSKDGTIIPGEISYTLDVNTEGLFTVKVENSLGCSNIRTIKVTASDVAKIDSIDIQDMSEINTVKVNVSTSSLGDYEYSLDERLGPFQDSNFFDNVSAGIHEVFVNDKNGCRPITQATIAVVGTPKFFTPNGDGYNDYWSVKGVNETFNSKSIIYIFDRYGKLLKQWVPTLNQGWDGTFNGVPLPADDYWFTLKLEDGREAKGHFSLKR